MAMTLSLPKLKLYKQKRDELEWLMLLHEQDRVLKCQYFGLTVSDWMQTDYKIALDKHINKLVDSTWPPVVQHQLSECSTLVDKIQLLLK